MFPPNPMYETNAIQLHFYCGSFDIYHSGLAYSVLFFVPVFSVKLSTVMVGDFLKKIRLSYNILNLQSIHTKYEIFLECQLRD